MPSPCPDAWRQLALPFAHTPHYAAADFLAAGSNEAALAWLDGAEAWPQHRLALWGGEGSGKTHLLHRWAARTGASVLAGPALPRLQGAPAQPLAIDDADAAPEQPLLHWLNAAAEAGRPVLLAGRAPPARWATTLADLGSRLRAMSAVEVRTAEDSLLRALLARLLAERQLAVAAPVQDWLLARLPRTPAAVREAAARLDHAGLAAGRPISRGIAAQVLAGLVAADDRSAPAAEPASTPAPRFL